MTSVLTIRNKANDLLPIVANGDSLNEFGKYYRFTGPLVRRLLSQISAIDNDGLYVVDFVKKSANIGITNIRKFEEGEIMETGINNRFLVRVFSIGASTPARVKNELDAFASVRNIRSLVQVVYASIQQNKNACSIPVKLSESDAKVLVDILAKDGTVAAVVLDTDVNTILYESPLASKEEVVEKPVKAAKAKASKEVDAEYFYLEDDVRATANILYSLFANPSYEGVHTMLLSGPSGYGKTAFCKVLAKKLGMDLVNFDMSLVAETEEIMGHRSISEGTTKFELNEFATKVQKGNVIIVLDELNRTYAGALNALFPFLDDRKGNNFQGHDIKVGKRVIFIGTRNVGIGYVGTHQSDDALLRRFQFSVNVGDLPKDEEITLLMKRTGCERGVASTVARVAKSIRDSDTGVNCSPATTLLVASMAVSGVAPRVTFQLNLVNKLEDIDIRRTIEELLNRELGMTFNDALIQSTFEKVF